ncbi:MAG: hypothetical protein ACSLFP_12395 [Acidimicrobiales bacterium]
MNGRLAMLLALIGAGACGVMSAGTASAQEADEVIGDVEISFDVGDVDPDTGEWSIEVVEVSGDLEDGQEFTVELTGTGAEVVWSATQAYTAPVTRIRVTEPIGVGEVTGAGVSQGITAVAGVQIEPPTVDFSASAGGGGGQLALSMVMAVLLVAIVFRTPLPSATTQRWTK